MLKSALPKTNLYNQLYWRTTQPFKKSFLPSYLWSLSVLSSFVCSLVNLILPVWIKNWMNWIETTIYDKRFRVIWFDNRIIHWKLDYQQQLQTYLNHLRNRFIDYHKLYMGHRESKHCVRGLVVNTLFVYKE